MSSSEIAEKTCRLLLSLLTIVSLKLAACFHSTDKCLTLAGQNSNSQNHWGPKNVVT